MKNPINGAAEGSSRIQSPSTRMGKMIFSTLPTGRSWLMRILRSLLVVRARMMGGWIMGTSAM